MQETILYYIQKAYKDTLLLCIEKCYALVEEFLCKCPRNISETAEIIFEEGDMVETHFTHQKKEELSDEDDQYVPADQFEVKATISTTALEKQGLGWGKDKWPPKSLENANCYIPFRNQLIRLNLLQNMAKKEQLRTVFPGPTSSPSLFLMNAPEPQPCKLEQVPGSKTKHGPMVPRASPENRVSTCEFLPQRKVTVQARKHESPGPFRRLKDFMQALHQVIVKNNKIQLLDPYANNHTQGSRNKAIRLPSMPRTPGQRCGPLGAQSRVQIPFTPSYSYFESLKSTPRQGRWTSCIRNMQARGTTATRLQYVPLTQTRRVSPRDGAGSCKQFTMTQKGASRIPTLGKAKNRKLELPSTLFVPATTPMPETSFKRLQECSGQGLRTESQTQSPHHELRRTPQARAIRHFALRFVPRLAHPRSDN